MSVFKKVTAIVSAVLATLLVTLFCVLFTAPGNQLLAYTANKLVDGLTIEIKNGRFLYNDAFNLQFDQNGVSVNAQQLKIDLFWWQCDGICIDNLSAKSIKLTLPKSAENKDDTPTEALEKITLPFNIALKNLAIDEFILNHSSANVTLNTLQLSAKAEGSDVTIKRLTIPRINVVLKEQTAAQQAAANQQTTTAIKKLPALPNIDFISPLNINVEQFNITNVTINQGEQHYSIDDIALQMSVEDATIKVQSLSAGYQQWQLNTQLDATLEGAMPINGNISLKGNEHGATLDINGDLAKLNIALDTTGLFPLNLRATANLKQKNYPFSVNGKINQWLINTQNNELKVKKINLSAQGNANDYQLSLTGNTQLDAYPSVDLNAQLKGTLTNATLETLALKTNDSAANIQAQLDWQQGIKADFTGVLSNLKAQYLTDALTSDVSGTFKGVFNAQADTWQLQMNNTKLAGFLNNVPLEFAANFKLDNQLKADIDSFYLSSGANKLTLNGQVDDTWQVDGDITLNSDEQANLPFIANGKADLKVRGNRLTPSVNLAVILERFIFNEININKLAIKSQLDTAADWQTDLSVNVASALVAGQQINNINIAASGDKTDHQLSASIDAEKGAVELELNGKMKNAIWNGELSDITLSDKKLSFNNTKKISVMVNTQNGDFDVSAHCWQSAQSKLCIDTLSQTKALGQFNAKLANLSLAELKHLLPDNIRTRGDLTGDFAANWQSGALKTLRANVNSNGLNAVLTSEEDRFKLPIETLSIRAFSDSQVGKIEANLSSSVLGKIATDINIDDIQNTQTLSGNVNIDKILLSDIQPFLDTLEQLKGAISGQVTLAGTLKDPQLDGELNIADINLEGEQLPVALKDSNIHILFNKTTATIKGNLSDPQGGQVKLTGDVDWQGEQPAVNVAVVGNEFFVRAQQGVIFKVSPDLKIGIADNALNLVGEVVVPYGRIEIEELPEGAVQVSDDEIIIDQKTQAAKKVPFDYDIDLKVTVKNDVKVESFGLKSKVTGDLALKMSQGTPIIATGELNLIEGTYLAFGQDLIIRTGQVGFSGAIDKPYLNIKAIRNPDNTADGVIAGVTLTGSVEQPTLKVFSEPAMDQAQALAYLLNGQPLGEGDSSTDAMLTQLLLSQGVSRSEGVVSKVGETFGLSDVSLSSKGSGEQTKVEISGYIAPSLQVKYSVGVFDSLSEVAVRYQLLSKLYIEITSGLYQNVDILYKFDWD
ncbi:MULTISPECIES: translocation/assembly module TamB domain-containing protein [unclassified Pseudoalteromonas]|uniref:autotransporter assembly complex protein TamB n=1 Tax=unclassified Pseudoalteromonas TaxID=194690 RepID=UPI0025B50EDA|nr:MULTISPECIES: translocation/assembly module TamB domain-containing protein [unclassified Pseudoalteromonas]MDN3396633.1 translocation/assembly module TamB domain-containing protein [Pseudoalteromonas sp. APC 3215]MDN3431444.1 translocation/assembly module TamB domain-containing protein [Pseudoalteromonas sp. APC 3907]MDN3463806.1 translocation/assembly module TamB domain-containing protein [Pseudoalteromonas sp. APC 3495]MDN3471892.1 translocation/assembly module TamB domain-containing prote